MPSFTRTYTQEFVTKITPATLYSAKQIEGHNHMQSELEALGATQNSDGIYQMDSIAANQQLGLLIDYWLWQNYQTKGAEAAAQTAASESIGDTQDDFEGGGAV